MAFDCALKIFWLILSTLIICTVANEEIGKILQFVVDGNKHSQLDDSVKDFVLVLGKTSIGKTPFIMWLTMNNSLLISERKSKHGPFLMRDVRGKIGSSLIDSATIYPHLYKNANESTVYYDLPGFHDVRDLKYDLGTMYFIRNVVDHAKRVKILFVTDFDSVQLGGKRDIFLNSLRDVAHFVKSPNKFNQSIAIIVTKVPKLINGEKHEDDAIIALIETFLNEVKAALSRKNINDPLIPYIEIIERNIGIFRFPDKSGPFSEIEILRPGKFHVEDILNHKLVFANTDKNDFDYMMSDKSKAHLKDVHKKIITTELMSNIQIVCHKIETFYSKQINEIKDCIVLNATTFETCAKLKKAKNDMDPLIVAQQIAEIGRNLNIASTTVNMITNNIRYIKFLLNIDPKIGFRTPQKFIECIKNTKSFILNKYNDYVDKSIENLLNIHLLQDINLLLGDIRNFYLKKNQQFDLEIIRNHLTDAIKVLKQTKSVNGPHFYLTKLIEIINKLNIGTNTKTIDQITIHVNEIIFLSKVKNQIIPNPPIFMETLTNCIERLELSKKWYDFLAMLYENLSENPSLQSIIAEVKLHSDYAMRANDLNLEKLMHNVRDIHINNLYATIRDLELTELEMRAFKNLLDALMSGVSIMCPSNNATKMFVRGKFVRISEIIGHECWPNAMYIEIFALDSIIIDSNIRKSGEGVQIVMIAPKWQMSSPHKIALNGMDKTGKSVPASDGDFPSGRGKDAEKGSDGDNGGDFFGIYEIFVNEQQLTIETNGGRGADGQHGGNG